MAWLESDENHSHPTTNHLFLKFIRFFAIDRQSIITHAQIIDLYVRDFVFQK